MKFSEAMLKGFGLVNGEQTSGWYFQGTPTAPTAVCVLGARNLATTGVADIDPDDGYIDCMTFKTEWGFDPDALNDEGMPWEHIYGMAVAAGL